MEKSSLKLVSNIMLKSKYEKNPIGFHPYDLLGKTYHDVRGETDLSEYQKLQKEKSMFVAECVVSDDDE